MADCNLTPYQQSDGPNVGGVVLNAEDCLLTMLRTYIDDLGENQLYSDNRLMTLLSVASFSVINELVCCKSVKTPVVDPCNFTAYDPVEYPSFVQLTVLKAACMVNQGIARSKARAEGITAKCGSASMSLSGSGSSSIKILIDDGPCQSYKELKKDLCFRCPLQSGNFCYQLVGAFSNKNFSAGNCGCK